VKNEQALMIRFLGQDERRLFVIQRADQRYWSDGEWVSALDAAQVFKSYVKARQTCRAIQRKRYAGKPLRAFKCELTITLVGDSIEGVSLEMLRRFMTEAVRIEVDTWAYGDGPIEGSYFLARVEMKSLQDSKVVKAAL
jgi:hypothetical protein